MYQTNTLYTSNLYRVSCQLSQKQTKNAAIIPFYLQDPGQCPQPSQGFGESLPTGLDSPFTSSLISHVQMGLSLHFLELTLILLCPSQLSFSICFFQL